MTVRELRKALFEIQDQKMTVKELRDILFELENQDAELKPEDLIQMIRRVEG